MQTAMDSLGRLVVVWSATTYTGPVLALDMAVGWSNPLQPIRRAVNTGVNEHYSIVTDSKSD